MISAMAHPRRQPCVAKLAAALLSAAGALCVGGCGGSAGTTFSGNTSVTLFITGTANDQLTSFYPGLETLTLTAKDGTSVDLLSGSPVMPELIHLNGTLEPDLTVSIPQGLYVSASATSGGGAGRCNALGTNSSGYTDQDNTFGFMEPAKVAVTLPSPITVTGASVGLVLNSLVSESAGVPSDCSITGTFSFTPAYTLTPISLSGQQPANSANGLALRLQGMIASVDAGSDGFSLSRMYDQPVGQTVTWQVASNTATAYQGITGFSQLAVGMILEMDGLVQQDGSLLATRIEVYDANPNNLTAFDGPLLFTNVTLSWSGGIETQHLLQIGQNTSQGAVDGYFPLWNDGNTTFKASPQLGNVGSLPFSATFDASSVAPGQHVLATTHDSFHDIYSANGYASATTITLIPQTINGTVSAIGSEGGFTTYTITLAPYDLFPQFAAAEAYQVSAPANPSTVVVYADSNTQMLNTNPIAVGSVVRFYGLVFNDSGTLRMDCAQINNGVAQ
jgi:Domain of unknown function (DUF5666)